MKEIVFLTIPVLPGILVAVFAYKIGKNLDVETRALVALILGIVVFALVANVQLPLGDFVAEIADKLTHMQPICCY